MDGKGTMTYENGSTYEGDWTNGQKDGKGTYTCTLYTYDGDWKNDEEDGKGTMTYDNGAKFEGNWKHGKMDGKFTLTSVDGSTCEVYF